MNRTKEDLVVWHELLQDACAKVPGCYMLLPVEGKEAPEYRERVYCYELYHQLRNLVDNKAFPYCLGGEIDKAGHPLIRGNNLDRAKPDLAAHEPGDMSRNLSVVEVKPVGAALSEIADDLRKLTAFRSIGRYHSAYFLLYGGGEFSLDSAQQPFFRIAADQGRSRNIDFGVIRLLWHQKPSTKPKELSPPVHQADSKLSGKVSVFSKRPH